MFESYTSTIFSLRKINQNKIMLKLLLMLVSCNYYCNSFNISPVPSTIFKKPNWRSSSERSSYFGFSLNLRSESLIVAAPRANYTSRLQKNVEPGEIYKCSLQTGNCEKIFDEFETTSPYATEIINTQWYGASMDGGYKETDPLVFCAPRKSFYSQENLYPYGMCYFVRNPEEYEIEKLLPLKQPSIIDAKFYYGAAQVGISVHLSEEMKAIVMGAPGVYDWQGSVIVDYYTEIDNVIVTTENLRLGEYSSEFSYLGYSVSSGKFDESGKNYIVASAPRYNYDGIVAIFELIGPKFERKLLLSGSQTYEYFGYSIIVDDITNDGISDIIVSAPLYTDQNRFDIGSVYVFKMEKEFSYSKLLIVSPNFRKSGGRFGTTIAKLGDINEDGFNDIAISAPFDDNGVVYIYHGSQVGLQSKPSQVLVAEKIDGFSKPHMFGLGISGGVDIDGNMINDLVIGAPNADRVYLFRSYPIVKVEAYFKDFKPKIQFTQETMNFSACVLITELKREYAKELNFEIKISADKIKRRLRLDSGLSEWKHQISVKPKQEFCIAYDLNIQVNPNNIFEPFSLEMEVKLKQQILSDEYCRNCVAVDPSSKTIAKMEIEMEITCNEGKKCRPDLNVQVLSPKTDVHILGTSTSLKVLFKVTNQNDSAFMPLMNITSNQNLTFSNVEKFCNVNDFVMQCNLWTDQQYMMKFNESTIIEITFDTSNLYGSALKLNATVFSSDEELNDTDNSAEVEILLQESSEIEIAEITDTQILYIYDDHLETMEITKKFKITNFGPSSLSNAEILIWIPILSDNKRVVNISNIKVIGSYLKHTLVGDSLPDQIIIVNKDNALIQTNNSYGDFISYDKISSELPVVEKFEKDSSSNFNSSEYFDIVFPMNRTILLSCHENNQKSCALFKLKIDNFKADPFEAVKIALKFSLNLEEIDVLLENSDDEFLLHKTYLTVGKESINKKTYNITMHHTLNDVIIRRITTEKAPIWIYIISLIIGSIVYLAISYGLYKSGFFKRDTHETVQELKRQSLSPSVKTGGNEKDIDKVEIISE